MEPVNLKIVEKQALRFRADMPRACQNLTGSGGAVCSTIFYPGK